MLFSDLQISPNKLRILVSSSAAVGGIPIKINIASDAVYWQYLQVSLNALVKEVEISFVFIHQDYCNFQNAQ